MNKEQKIASFQQGKDKLQLLKITTTPDWAEYNPEIAAKLTKVKYQVRLNRKRISTSYFEYTERKIFASYAQNIILQLKIY